MILRTSSLGNTNLAVLAANSVVIVDSEVTIDADCQLNPNITLIFEGGKITSSSVSAIIGANTVLIAPRTCIFNDNISASGLWNIEEAYPEWFGAIAYKTKPESEDNAVGLKTSSAAINKAICMKKTGNVTFKEGFYVIESPIDVPSGIQLIGTIGNRENEDSTNHDVASGTIFRIKKSFIKSSAISAVITLNKANATNRDSENENNISTSYQTCIRNIIISNYSNQVDLAPIAILVKCNAKIEKLIFYNISEAVKTADGFEIDRLTINGCISEYYRTDAPNSYLYYLSGIKSSLDFSQNMIHNGLGHIQGVYLESCQGATFMTNIINSDVEFQNCKAVVYNNNHMEYGAQVRIFASQVSMGSNYIERKRRPPLVILSDSNNNISVVDLNDHVYGLRGLVSLYYKENGLTSPYPSDDELNDYKAFNDYDIITDHKSLISIKNNYRDTLLNGATDSQPCGIMVGLVTSNSNSYSENAAITPLDDFNQDSYILSVMSKILRGKVFNKIFDISDIACKRNISVYKIVPEENKPPKVWWIDISGSYVYAFQLLWDKQRSIVGCMNGNPLIIINETDNAIQLNFGELQGVRLSLHFQIPVPLRLYRGCSFGPSYAQRTKLDYVDIPIVACEKLVDNGYDISGYKWNPITDLSPYIEPDNPTIIGMHKIGKNVGCTASSLGGQYQGWIPGDQIAQIQSQLIYTL